jgi:hypothetical protein
VFDDGNLLIDRTKQTGALPPPEAAQDLCLSDWMSNGICNGLRSRNGAPQLAAGTLNIHEPRTKKS